MIVFDLACSHSHRFEGWFRSTADYEDQLANGLLQCPECGCEQIAKAPMAPAVPAKSNTRSEVAAKPDAAAVSGGGSEKVLPAKLVEAMKALAKVQAETIKDSTWVGEEFARQSREMHYGERDEALIHGKATAEEARELLEEGIAVVPLLIPFAPPDKLN